MTLNQIEKALRNGDYVYWLNIAYMVKMPNKGKIQDAYIEYLPTSLCWGLTNKKTGKLIDKSRDFFISNIDYSQNKIK